MGYETLKGKPLDQAPLASSSSAPSLASAALNATSTATEAPSVIIHVPTRTSQINPHHHPQHQQMVGETLRMALAKVMIATKTVGISILSMNQNLLQLSQTFKLLKKDLCLSLLDLQLQAQESRPKINSARAAAKYEDDDLWGSIAAPQPATTSRPLNLKKDSTVY
ncbi:unnamed protein product [Brassica oleracea]